MSKISNVKFKNNKEETIRHINDWFVCLGKLSSNKDINGLKVLIEKFPNWILAVDEGGWDGLFVMSSLGFSEGVSLFIDHGADVNRKAADGSTAFHAVVGPEHVGAALKIIEAGGDPSIQDNVGLTPMMMVCDKGLTNLFKIILNKHPQSIIGKDKKDRDCYTYANERGNHEIISIINDDRMRRAVSGVVVKAHVMSRI